MDVWCNNITTMVTGIDARISDKAEIVQSVYVEMGDHVSIDSWVYISTKAILGDYIHIAPHVCVIGGVNAVLVMHDFTNIGAGSKIVVISDDFTRGMINPIVPNKHKKLIGGVITMERFSLIGVNSVVLPNVTMAEGSVLGANSLLNQDTEPWTIYAGSPAKPINKRDKESILKSAKELGYE